MLAHFFLWRLKLRLGKKSPSTDGVTAASFLRNDGGQSLGLKVR
jgi:hypothetical protein